MPVLMIALFALACFGVIGILLAVAVAFEPKKSATQANPHAAKSSVSSRGQGCGHSVAEFNIVVSGVILSEAKDPCTSPRYQEPEVPHLCAFCA